MHRVRLAKEIVFNSGQTQYVFFNKQFCKDEDTFRFRGQEIKTIPSVKVIGVTLTIAEIIILKNWVSRMAFLNL